MSEKCDTCKNIVSSNRVFMINKKLYCNENCFKIGFNLNEYQKKISKLSIK